VQALDELGGLERGRLDELERALVRDRLAHVRVREQDIRVVAERVVRGRARDLQVHA
jgi:hypothetical protein